MNLNEKYQKIFKKNGRISYHADKKLLKAYYQEIKELEKNNSKAIKHSYLMNTKRFILDEQIKIEESKLIAKTEKNIIDLSGYDEINA